MNCLNCNQETPNPKFCSMSCAAKYNNKKYPKRIKIQPICTNCGKPKARKYSRTKFCKLCRPRYGQDMTLREAKYDKTKNPFSVYALVRGRARTIMSHIKACQKCGYHKHVEVAHIKAVATFSDDTLISVVNDPSNLLVLCPNCHWEFDHKSEYKESNLSVPPALTG